MAACRECLIPVPAQQWDEDNGLCSSCLESALYDDPDDYYFSHGDDE